VLLQKIMCRIIKPIRNTEVLEVVDVGNRSFMIYKKLLRKEFNFIFAAQNKIMYFKIFHNEKNILSCSFF